MKRALIILLGMMLFIPVFSQDLNKREKVSSDSNELRTLFGHRNLQCNIPFGYFIELSGGYTKIGNRDAFLPGISMGIIMNHHWTMGATGSFINGRGVDYPDIYYNAVEQKMDRARLTGGYGGALFEYTVLPRSVVHLSFPVMIGGGYLAYYPTESHDSLFYFDNRKHTRNHDVGHSHFFVVEPGVKMEINLAKYLRVGLTVSYRYVPDLDLVNTPDDRFNQFNAKLSIRLGKF